MAESEERDTSARASYVRGYRLLRDLSPGTRKRAGKKRDSRGVTRPRRKHREGEREDFLKLHFVAPERPYTGISTPTARDNEASIGAAAFAEVRDAYRWVRTSQRAAHGDIIDIREE